MTEKKRTTRDFLERILRIVGATYVAYLVMSIIYILFNYLISGTASWAEAAGGYIFIFFFANVYFLFTALIILPLLYILHVSIYYFIKNNNIRYIVLLAPFIVLSLSIIISDVYGVSLFALALLLPPIFFTYYFNKKMDNNILEEIPVIEDENLLDDIID